MTPLTKAYCDGAAMAYRDVAAKLRELIANAPIRIRGTLDDVLMPIAISCEAKAQEVYALAYRSMMAARR